MLVFGTPDAPESDHKSLTKTTWKQTTTKTTMLAQGARKAIKMGSPNPHKIHKNLSLDPRCPLAYSKVPLDRLNGPQGPRVEAPGIPNDRFGHPK